MLSNSPSAKGIYGLLYNGLLGLKYIIRPSAKRDSNRTNHGAVRIKTQLFFLYYELYLTFAGSLHCLNSAFSSGHFTRLRPFCKQENTMIFS